MKTFETEPNEKSCGYCQFHGGFLRKANIQARSCIHKHCRWLILFTEHPDYKTFGLWEEDRVQRYRGKPYRFLELYGDLIRKPEAKSERDEPGMNVSYEEWKRDDYQAFRRKVKEGTARKVPNRKRRFREKRDKRREREEET